jgi:hypothetical protein
MTEVGLRASELKAGGVTVNVAVLELVPRVAVIVTEVDVETADVDMVNVAVVLPAATVTEEGTVAVLVLLLDRVTTVPPVGAATDRVTVP